MSAAPGGGLSCNVNFPARDNQLRRPSVLAGAAQAHHPAASLYTIPACQSFDPERARPVVKGDSKCLCIAAASVIAKVTCLPGLEWLRVNDTVPVGAASVLDHCLQRVSGWQVTATAAEERMHSSVLLIPPAPCFDAPRWHPQVTRDRLMLALHEQYPQYNFAGM